MTRAKKVCERLWMCGLFVALLCGVPAAGAEWPPPSGTVSMTATAVAAGVGIQWGEGILSFGGQQYPFTLQGLQIVGVGYAQVRAEGYVYGLHKLEEFDGVYAAASAAAAAGRGPGSVVMQNPDDVVISLRMAQEGVHVSVAAGGVEIKLKK